MDRKSAVILGIIFGGLFLSLFGFLVLAWVAVQGGEGGGFSSGPSIGVLEVTGQISTSDKALKDLRRFAKEDQIKALLVRIDSPGGSVAPSQEIYSELRELSKSKPVICSMGNVAASGGYYIAAGCQKIVANPGTLTGSIGVISQLPYVGDIAEKLEFQMVTIKSGKLKDVGNPFREMSEDERTYFQGMMDRVHEQFIEAVAQGRNLEIEKVRPYADGRILTGKDALDAGLVDQLGNFNDAIKLAASEAGIEGEPKLQYPPDEEEIGFGQLFNQGGKALVRGVIDELSASAGVAPRSVGPAYLMPMPVGN